MTYLSTNPTRVRPTVLVTGGAGYIGSHVCKALAEFGYLPLTFDNLSGGHRSSVRWGPLFIGDVLRPNHLDDAMHLHRPVAVIHLAGLIAAGESVEEPAKYYDNNVTGTLNTLAAMRDHNLERIVFSSSAAVYGEPKTTPIAEDHSTEPVSPYGATKLHSERMISDFSTAHGTRSVSLRYFNAAGADPDAEIGEAHPVETHLIPIILDVAAGKRPHVQVFGDDYPTEDGTCIRDYVHVSDLARAHVLALDFLSGQPGAHCFNLGGGMGYSVRQIIDRASAVTAKQIATDMQPRRPGDPAVLLADTALARQTLGWQPKYSDITDQLTTAWTWHCRDVSDEAEKSDGTNVEI